MILGKSSYFIIWLLKMMSKLSYLPFMASLICQIIIMVETYDIDHIYLDNEKDF